MVDWLLAPIDPARPHDLAEAAYWHGRLMVLAWAFLFPIGILAARFFKVMPGQDWPRVIDNLAWWHAHLALQYTGGAVVLIALGLILWSPGGGGLHAVFGWWVIALCLYQFLAGWLRGTKGGPTDNSMRGDHYDMTPRRKLFEYSHKSLGYLALVLSVGAIATGLWLANAPRWMWLAILAWWATLIIAFIAFQRRGMSVDTYQALWGPSEDHPGNRMKPIGWGVVRRDPETH